MIIQPPKTIEAFEKALASIIELQSNPYCDYSMIISLIDKREKVEAKIKELKAQQLKTTL
jgi:hypothetical protein